MSYTCPQRSSEASCRGRWSNIKHHGNNIGFPSSANSGSNRLSTWCAHGQQLQRIHSTIGKLTEEPVAFRTSTFVALLQSRRGKCIAAYVFIFTDLLYSPSLKRDTLVGSPVGKTIVNFNEVVGNLPALGSVSAAQSIIITP